VSRRARGLALLGAALACAGLAASSVSRYTNDVRAQVGPPVSVLVAHRDLPRGTPITPRLATEAFELRRVPTRFAPPGALASATAAQGFRLATALRPGDYLTDSILVSGRGAGPAEVAGGRIVEIEVAGARSFASALHPGTHVDVLITTDRGAGPARTYLALQDAELAAFSPASGGPDPESARATAGLRVSLRQAVLLTAAQNFARELRLVPRSEGDRRRLGPIGVSATGLGG
jgi:pilus assembly protein CpaB